MARNLRKQPRVSYAEPEEPAADEYVFCTECRDYVYEYCSIHGPLLVVPDDKVPAQSPYPAYVPRAALTIPHVFLHLARSSIPGAGVGVFSTLTLPSGVRFGPYRGVRSKEVTSLYCWQMYDRDGKRSHVIDADDANNSNWMRYVNCSRHWREQNLVAYQYRGELYYRTIKIIPRFTELLVFYGAQFANMLRVNIRAYNCPKGYAQKLGAPPKKTAKTLKKTPHTVSTKEIEPKLNQANRVDSNNKENQQKCEKKSEEPKVKKVKKSSIKKYVPPIKKTKEILNEPNITDNGNIEVLNTSSDKQNLVHEPVTKKAKFIQPTTTKNEIIDANNNFQTYTQQINVKVTEKFFQNDLLCDICNYKTNSQKSLELHLILHTQDKNILKCSYCGYMTKMKPSLIRHLRSHTGEKPFLCNVCNYKCIESGFLKNHMKIHTGEKPFACNVCNYKCTQSGNLKMHMKIHTGEKPFSCNVCNYKCTQSGTLKMHMKIHTGEKPFSCNVCNYKCIRSGNLKMHTKIHTGEKPFSCNVCNYKCTQSGNLKMHMKIHTGEKPFSCNVCNYKCIRSGNLKMHTKIHTGEKPFSCNVCNYKCTQSGNLKMHMKIHTGEKPFSCNVCNYKCTQSGTLKRHMKIHTGEKPFSCNVCNYKCGDRYTLKRHISTRHSAEIQSI